MIAVEVMLNNEKLTTAATEDLCVLSAIVNAVGKLGSESHGTHERKSDFDLSLYVGGVTSRGEGVANDHLNWLERRPIELGDTVTLRFIESSHADQATVTMLAGGSANEMNERRIFESAKETYFKLKDKFE